MAKTFVHRSQNTAHAQYWLVAHDISDPKRLQKVWRYLSKEGLRLQYSVYLLRATSDQMQSHMGMLASLTHAKQDDVRAYPLTQHARMWGLGVQFDDGGNVLSDAFLDAIKQRVDASLASTLDQI